MRALVQEACQGPVRDAVAQHAHKLADLSEADLRPLVLRDFQACTRNKVITPQANGGCASVAEALTNSWICNTSLRSSIRSPPLISTSQFFITQKSAKPLAHANEKKIKGTMHQAACAM